MNKKVCEKCGNLIDDNSNVCQVCNNSLYNQSDFNIFNPFINNGEHIVKEDKPVINNNEHHINNNEMKKEDIKTDGILFYRNTDNKVEEMKENNIKTHQVKQKKNNNNFFSFLTLIQAIILLLIILFSSWIELVLPFLVHYVLTVIVLMVSFNFTYRNKNVGYYLSIIAAVSMIFMVLEKDYISAFMGVVIFVTSFIYLLKK